MKVKSITTDIGSLSVTPIGDRYYRINCDTKIKSVTSIGCFNVFVQAGFITNFRSGGVLVDGFVDQVGDEQKSLVYLLHDIFYTPGDSCGGEHPVSRALADEFLRDALAWAGMGSFKRNLVYRSVRMFGNSAYVEDDNLTETNRKLFKFSWGDK